MFALTLSHPQGNNTVSFWSEHQTTPVPDNLKGLDDFTIEFQQTEFGSDLNFSDANYDPNYLWSYQNIKLRENLITINSTRDGGFYFERYKENSNKWFMSYSSKPGYQSMLVAAECENMPEEYNQLLDTMRDHYKLSKNL